MTGPEGRSGIASLAAGVRRQWTRPDEFPALTVVEREFTLVGVNPSRDEFIDLAAQMRDAAHEAVREAGRILTAAMAA